MRFEMENQITETCIFHVCILGGKTQKNMRLTMDNLNIETAYNCRLFPYSYFSLQSIKSRVADITKIVLFLVQNPGIPEKKLGIRCEKNWNPKKRFSVESQNLFTGFFVESHRIPVFLVIFFVILVVFR